MELLKWNSPSFDLCFLLTSDTTSVGMQIHKTVHFLPVFLWLASYYFYSPCPVRALKALRKETGAIYFTGIHFLFNFK